MKTQKNKINTPMEDISLRKPIDIVASRVIGKGVEYRPLFKKGKHLHSKTPPPMENFCDTRSKLEDMTGRKIGRFTVIGVAKKRKNKGEIRYVVKCVCGNYEIMSRKAILNGLRDRCKECSHIDKIKRKNDRYGNSEIRECPHCHEKKLFSLRKKYCSAKCRVLASGREWVEKN